MDAAYLKTKHEAGLSYDEYLATGTADQRESWCRIHEQAWLTHAQVELIGSFVRRMNVIVVSGIWCGDCVQQGPLIQRIAEANPEAIDMRWLDRDEHEDLARQVKINAGGRVPVIIFCAEDHELVGWFGDRTLSRYRYLAEQKFGPSCPVPGAPVPDQHLAATTQDWLDQFERVQLLLRLSPRLKQLHEA